jgi:hypothetical protein
MLVPLIPPMSPSGDVIEGVGKVGVRNVSEREIAIAAADARVAEELHRVREEREFRRKMDVVAAYQYAENTYEDGAVVRFTKRWTDVELRAGRVRERASREYTYVALKAGDRWYVTGKPHGGKSLTWEEFVTWLVSGDDPVTPDQLEFMVPGTHNITAAYGTGSRTPLKSLPEPELLPNPLRWGIGNDEMPAVALRPSEVDE